jgi:AbrB family looped-hinge helix DNA binding protein
MPSATVTSKGQVTIPVQVRSALGIEAGDRIEFVETEKGKFAIVPADTPVQRLMGIIQKPAQPVSTDQMNVAVAKRAVQSSQPKK